MPRVHTKVTGKAGPRTWEAANRCPEHMLGGGPSPRVGALQRPQGTRGSTCSGFLLRPLAHLTLVPAGVLGFESQHHRC